MLQMSFPANGSQLGTQIAGLEEQLSSLKFAATFQVSLDSRRFSVSVQPHLLSVAGQIQPEPGNL